MSSCSDDYTIADISETESFDTQRISTNSSQHSANANNSSSNSSKLSHPKTHEIDASQSRGICSENPAYQSNVSSDLISMKSLMHEICHKLAIIESQVKATAIDVKANSLTLASLKENMQNYKDKNNNDYEYFKNILPVSSLHNFDDVEKQISSNTLFSNQLEKTLSFMAGGTLATSVRNIINFIMNNNVQRQFNMNGGSRPNLCIQQQEPKRAFRETLICGLVISEYFGLNFIVSFNV